MGEKFKHIRERNSHTRLVRDEGLLIKPTVDSFAFPNIRSIHAIQCPRKCPEIEISKVIRVGRRPDFGLLVTQAYGFDTAHTELGRIDFDFENTAESLWMN